MAELVTYAYYRMPGRKRRPLRVQLPDGSDVSKLVATQQLKRHGAIAVWFEDRVDGPIRTRRLGDR